MARKFTLQNDCFCGHFMEGSIHPQKAIIYTTGADGHEKTAIESSKLFIEQGYSVLTLGFVKWKGLSKNLWGIPVEYVEHAAQWLLSYKDNRENPYIHMVRSSSLLTPIVAEDYDGGQAFNPPQHISIRRCCVF
jgi:hypothetical protein